MYWNTPNYEQASGLVISRARELQQQLFENRINHDPPFLPTEYLSLLGITEIIRSDLGDVSGALLRVNEGQMIMLNQRHNVVRQNFSCAHEIGHILFNELKLQQCINKIEFRSTLGHQANEFALSRIKERLCDIAATELLMPREIFRKYLVQFGININSISLLANTFSVSNSAAAIRIGEVSPEVCRVLCWKSFLDRGKRVIRLTQAPNAALCSPIHNTIERNSALFRAFERDEVIKSYKLFRFQSGDMKRCYMETKGFGFGETRAIISIVFNERLIGVQNK